MSYIKFDKEQLVSLEASTTKELLRTNSLGSYSCTSLNFCNTRKYHGLLVMPQPQIDNDRHVLLSCIDETVIQNNSHFNLGLHKYINSYSPKGHKYVEDFQTHPIPTHIYRVGGVRLKKEIIFSSYEDRLLIKYTLLEAKSKTFLKIQPYLAFRNFHTLSKANLFVDTKYKEIENGVSFRMYNNYPYLHFQFSKKTDYIHVPDWYKDFEYVKELERGYEGHEDLYVPGYFETEIEKGESIFLSVGVNIANHLVLNKLFDEETAIRTPRNNFENTLKNSLKQFLTVRNDEYLMVAGYPWYFSRPRDTFVSLLELSLSLNNINIFYNILKTQIQYMDGPYFSFVQGNHKYTDFSADTSLFFIRCLQQFVEYYKGTELEIWEKYSKVIKTILYGFKSNDYQSVRCNENGLLNVSFNNEPHTWMNARVDNNAITLRDGMTIEANSLWYNAIMFSISLAEKANDDDFVKEWKEVSNLIFNNFKNVFWNKDRGYLADYVNENVVNWAIRPNMIFAASLPFSPVSEKIQSLIIEKIRAVLLTPRGLRTLSPDNKLYKSHYFGNENQRARAYHQGTAWPWLLGSYLDACLKIFGKSKIYELEKLYLGIEDSIMEHAIGSISEVYDGDPPHRGAGAISMAWSVAEVLRMKRSLEKFKSMEDKK